MAGSPPQYSADGRWYWNGQQWIPVAQTIATAAEADSDTGPPLRVFLSHTSDLGQPHGRETFVGKAVAAVQRAGHAVTDMAYFPARDTPPAAYCTDLVARSDVYVGIVGLRYGEPVRDRPDLAYTELEFEAACDHRKPRLIFLIRHDSAHLPPASESAERRTRQDAFRALLLRDAGLMAAMVDSPADLELALFHALRDLTVRLQTRAQALRTWMPANGQGTIDDRLARLAAVVRVQWEREANVRQFHDPQPIALSWTAADPRLMDHAEVIAGGRSARPGLVPGAAGRLEEVVDEFLRLPWRRLVVTGEPGAGKTGVLVLLTLGLLARWMPADPVPVLFSLGSWDPARTGFAQWLARHLRDEYPFVRPREAQAIVEGGGVIPILDGLDELPTATAAAAVAMINGAWLQRPLVVACRTREFARAVYFADVLTGAAVVELEPVQPEQAERYLRLTTPPDDRLARWEPVFAELRRDPGSPVAAALSTPLMVTLARTVYALDRSSDPAELTRSPSREAMEEHLLDTLVPALYAGSTRWSADRARTWLAFLAAHLRRRGTRDLAWWELAPGRARSQIARAVGAGFAFGFMAATAIALTPPGSPSWTLIAQNVAGATIFGIAAAILAGIASSITVGLSLIGLGALRQPSHLVVRLNRSFPRRFLIGAVTGVLVSLPFAVVAQLVEVITNNAANSFAGNLVFTAGVAVAVGVPLGLELGIIFGLVRPSEQSRTPASSLASNRLVCILTLLVAGLTFVLVAGWTFVRAAGYESMLGQTPSLSEFLAIVTFGLLGGLAIALGIVAVLPWGGYQLARLWLALHGRLPWRLFAFLDDAHKRGVLRQVGGVYQFRHARLQDRLAGPGDAL